MVYEFTVSDYLVLSTIVVISIGIGLYQVVKVKFLSFWRRYKRSGNYDIDNNEVSDENFNAVNDYLVASGSMGAFPIALSLLASFFSATSLLGIPAEVYEYGMQYWINTFGIMITPLIGAFATGPLFHRIKVLSIFEYLKLRYNTNFMRMIGVSCYLIRSFISAAVFIYGPVTILTLYIQIDKPIMVVLIGAIGTFYTTIGGIKAVIWADVFQMIVMLSALIIISVKGTVDLGGFERVWDLNSKGERLNFFDFDFDPFIRQSFWTLIIGNIFRFSSSYCIDQQMVQRFAAAKSKRVAQVALLLNIPAIFVFMTLCSYCGMVIYGSYADCDPLSRPNVSGPKDPNKLLSIIVSEKMNNIWGLNGLFVSSILCGSLSSVSSTLNSQSAILLEDFMKRFQRIRNLDDRKTSLIAKLLVLFAGTVSTVLALIVSNLGGNLIQISSTLNGSFNAPIIAIFLLGCLFPFTNTIGTTVGTVFGFGVACWLSFGSFIYAPQYPKLAVGMQCYLNQNDTNSTVFDNTTFSPINLTTTIASQFKGASNLSGFSVLYSLSYHWFIVVACFTAVIIGLIVSLLSGGYKYQLDDNLLLFKWLSVCKTRSSKKQDQIPNRNGSDAYVNEKIDKIEMNEYNGIELTSTRF